ncbi:MAG: AAC(3) family N-acetyltransferase [Erysipelothrix sp.]|nr:AAC(3) family N-acetyltransferase [Erysipelothrix sp.]
MEVNIMSKTALVEKFIKLNIKAGDSVYIESQITSFSFTSVQGSFFIQTLRDYLGPEGTIISNLNSQVQRIVIYDEVKGRNRVVNTYQSSELAKYLANFKDVSISKSSFYPYVAVGKYAEAITGSQSFDFPNGPNSPMARLYELHAKVLLINHDVRSMLVHNYCIESHPTSVIEVTNGIHNAKLVNYLNKSNAINLFDVMFKEKKYKRMFYYTKDQDNTLLSFSLREYVDYCNSVFERKI